MRRVITLTAALLISSAMSAEADSSGTRWWLSGGIGGGSFGAGAAVSLSCDLGPAFMSLRGAKSDKDALNWFAAPSPHETIGELAVLIGLNRPRPDGRSVSLCLGVSHVELIRRGTLIRSGWLSAVHEEVPYWTTGLAIDIQLWSWRSVGFQMVGNLNDLESFGMLLLVFREGKY